MTGDDQTAERLRICQTMPVYCHPDWRAGGVARAATDVCMALARRGHHVTVVSPLVDGDRTFERPERVEYLDGRLELHYVEAARSTRFGTSHHGLRAVLAPLLARTDVVHNHSVYSPWAHVAQQTTRRSGVPYVVQPHGKMSPNEQPKRVLPKKLYMRLGGRTLLRDAACVITLSAPEADAIEAWDPRVTCRVCPNGLDPEEFAEPPPPAPLAEPYILFLGWLDPRKNPDLLVRAFARVADRIASWTLALVGPDSYGMGPHLRELIEQSGLSERVVMPGLVRGTQKMAWLANAGVFVLPSNREGLSIAMLEALACGVPCLLSRGCNLPGLEAAGAGRTLALDERAWADALIEIAGDEPARVAAGHAARRLFERRFTLAHVAERLEAILLDVTGRGPAVSRDDEIAEPAQPADGAGV